MRRQTQDKARLTKIIVLVVAGLLSWPTVSESNGPMFNVDVRTSNADPEFILEDTDTDEANWRLQGDAINEAFSVQWGDEGSSAQPLVIENGAPDNALYIDNPFGFVGLGTSSPSVDLHIAGTATIMLEDTIGTTQLWALAGDDESFRVSDVNKGVVPLLIEADGQMNSLRIAADGNIGMGTETPSEAVDVVRSEAASRFQLTSFSSDASHAPQFIQRRARGTEAAPGTVQDGDNLGLFSFRGMRPSGNFSGSQATMTVQATENWTDAARGTRILFGTTPNGSSAVNTVVEITEDGKLKVNDTELDVPDEVFAEDYELMPLGELQAYLAEHHHLPEVANEAEARRDGVDVVGTQMTLLKKIEELTLYALEQHQELAALRAQNVQLAHQLATQAVHFEARLKALEQHRQQVSMPEGDAH